MDTRMEFMRQLEARMPGYDYMLDIDFGPTTYIYLVDGSTVVFRKCSPVAGNGTVAESPGDGSTGGRKP